MRLIAFALAGFGMLLGGCPRRPTVIPDRTIPHALSRDVDCPVWIWVRVGTSDAYVEQKVKLSEGWYVAAPEVFK